MKTIEKVLNYALCSSFFSGTFEDRAIFHVIQLCYDGGGGGLFLPLKDKK